MLQVRAVRRLQKRLQRLMTLLVQGKVQSWEEEPSFRRVLFFAHRVSQGVVFQSQELERALRNRDVGQALAIASTLYEKTKTYLLFS